MNLLWAFNFTPQDDTFTGMNMESYAVVSACLFIEQVSSNLFNL